MSPVDCLCSGVFQLVGCHISPLAEHLPFHFNPYPRHSWPAQPWPQAYLHNTPLRLLEILADQNILGFCRTLACWGLQGRSARN